MVARFMMPPLASVFTIRFASFALYTYDRPNPTLLIHQWGSASISDVWFNDNAIENLHGNNDGHQTWLAIHVQEGDTGVVGPIKDISIWKIGVQTRGKSPAVVTGVRAAGGQVNNVGLANIWFRDLNRPATSLGEMRIVGNYSSNVVVKD